MGKNKQILLTGFVLLLTFIFNIVNVSANNANPAINTNNLNIDAKGAYVIDANTGQILYSKNADDPLPMASVSKMITAYIVLEKINSNKLSWDTKIKISPEIAALSTNPMYTNVPLQQGHSYTVKQLYDASLICSANAAAMALGNYISGDSTNFGKLMSKTMHQLGIKNYQLSNACGLRNDLLGTNLKNNDVSDQAENEMTPLGLAKFTKILINKYPVILQTTKIQSFNWFGKLYSNTDLLLNKNEAFTIDGLKTGTSNTAGGNFVGTGKNKNSRIITVVLGAKQGQQFYQTKQIMDGIEKYLSPQKVTEKVIPTRSITIPNGEHENSELKLNHNKTLWIPNNAKLITKFQKIGNQYHTPLAPIEKNSEYGIVKVATNNNNLSFLQKNENEIKVVFSKQNNVDLLKMFIGFFELLILISSLVYLVKKII